MRVLFVSGTSVGGAARSTHELAALLEQRGHTVATLVRDENAPRQTYLHRRAVNLRVKFGTGHASRAVDRAARRIGARLRPDSDGRVEFAYRAVRPENALAAAMQITRPDVVVVNSIDLPAWRQVRADLQAQQVPVVLYLREETGLLHLSHSKLPPDLLFANATGHAEGAAALGHRAVVVPSIVDCSTCSVDSTRECVLFVNPVAMYGVDVALALAAARPDIPFAFVESWPLDAAALADLQARLDALPNVELRRYVPDTRALFRDVRVLLVPYRYPGRSRVIAEAQCSGIPVLASNLYGIAEAVGDGGLLADPDGPLDAWADAMSSLWDDHDNYDRLSAAALAYSRRAEMQPDAIARSVEHALADLISQHTRGPDRAVS
jgi:glycosyltransferase involved in cell wall biosynthesis